MSPRADWAVGRRGFLAGAAALAACTRQPSATHLVNVSNDPTRELYAEINAAFAAEWARAHAGAEAVAIEMSHGGSATQARAVIDGAPADVVTLALPLDIDQIADAGLINRNWRNRLPYNSAPYTSTIVFAVRAGNPKAVRDWADLLRDDVSIITLDPQTSGGARLTYLAAWAQALAREGSSQASALDFVRRLYAKAPVLENAARAATTRFAERGEGDVLITWEYEAYQAQAQHTGAQLEIVTPSISILAEPSIAWVDRNVRQRGSRDLAETYLRFLCTDACQEIAARRHFRPSNPDLLLAHADLFPELRLLTVDETFGSWREAYTAHFAPAALFDQIRGA